MNQGLWTRANYMWETHFDDPNDQIYTSISYKPQYRMVQDKIIPKNSDTIFNQCFLIVHLNTQFSQ